MRTLVVGGGEFLGFEITLRLLRDGHEVSVIALDPPPMNGSVEWIQVDRNNAQQLGECLSGRSFEAVVDNIAYAAVQVEKLLNALGGRCDRYVLTSTIDLYGKAFPRTYSERQGKLDPSDQSEATGNERYLRGKRGCEKALMAADVPWTIIRPAVVIGRRDNQSPLPAWHGIQVGEPSRSLFFPCRVRDGGPILLRQDDEAAFNLVWSADVASAISLLLKKKSAVQQTYNVAGSEIWTSERLVHALCTVAGRVAEVVRVAPALLASTGLADYEPPYGRGPVWLTVDNQKLRALGWIPTPPEIWLANLLEAAQHPPSRPWYERRLQEISLAYYVRRRRSLLPPLDHASPPTTRPSFRLTNGRISTEASARWVTDVFAKREPDVARNVLRSFDQTSLSCVGLGTWMGDTTAVTDQAYIRAITHAVRSGVNVIDTAINYRAMQAERCVGRALKRLEDDGYIRSMVLLCTKGGFIPHDASNSLEYRDYVKSFYVDKGLISGEEAAQGHSIRPLFIRYALEQSLNNLCVAHIDVYFLHNPEVSLEAVGPDAFYENLAQTFQVLEGAIASGRIGCYGVATWEGLRVGPSSKQHLSLQRVVDAARGVAGDGHHFRAIQMPYSVLRPEAYTRRCQEIGGRWLTPLQAAHELGLYCFTSATVGQATKLNDGILAGLKKLAPGLPAHSAMLQFARSTPGAGTALIGMRQISHVDAATRVAGMLPLGVDALQAFLGELQEPR